MARHLYLALVLGAICLKLHAGFSIQLAFSLHKKKRISKVHIVTLILIA